jgi:probable HAF family extracellular repeat protein
MRSIAWIVLLTIPALLSAQRLPSQHHHYKLIDTGTLGGPTSSLGFEGERDVNNRGTVVSLAETTIPDPYAPNCLLSDCFVGHAVSWQNGVLTDLGALPTINGSGPQWISDSGQISGFSENGVIDPVTGFPEFQAVLFHDGNVVNLGSFGGNESVAFSVNNRGQAAGCAANAEADPYGFCLGTPQQSRAFLWQNGTMLDLGTLGGPDALAELVNDRGQVAGWALLDSTPNPTTGIPTQHPFLWENGVMHDLGTIGGTAIFEVNTLNERGQVVGGMNVAGDVGCPAACEFHPFLWDGQSLNDLGTLGGNFGNADWLNQAGAVAGWATTAGDLAAHGVLWSHGKMVDLGVTPGNQCSVAYVLNAREQVVGGSDDCVGDNPRAFIWEKGSIADLNGLISAGSGVQLTVATGLNEGGEIVAQGVISNGDLHAFLLIPCDDAHPGLDGCDYSIVEASAPPPSATVASARPAQHEAPSHIPSASLWRRNNRFHFPLTGPQN